MTNDPALTYTLDDFIAMQFSDEITYHNFSIIEKIDGIELLDHNILEDYIDELVKLCIPVEFDQDQYNKYKYAPDILAYDVYKSTQLDFIILMINGLINPNEFTSKKIMLPHASVLKNFLSSVYNSEKGYISQNRTDNNMETR